MCFSPFASFTAAAGLSLFGLVSMRMSHTRAQQLLALVPLVFAVQQAIEGLVWRSFDATYTQAYMPYAYAFLFFAFMWWPTFIPLATWWSEHNSSAPSRESRLVQFVQLLCVCAGLITAGILGYGLLVGATTASAIGHHIVYNTPWMPDWIYVTYVCATIIPLLISRLPYLWMLGLAAAGSLAYSYHIYSNYTVSVWCFFAALLSSIIVAIIYLQNKQENPYSRESSHN